MMTKSTTIVAKSSVFYILLTLLRADLTVLWRRRNSVVMSILLPLIFLISWKDVVAFTGSEFVVATCLVVGLVGIGILTYPGQIASDRDRGVLQRLRATPIPAWTIMMSRLLVQVVTIWGMTCFILLGAYFLYHLVLPAQNFVLIMLVSILSGSMFLAFGQALVGLIGTADSVNATARLLSFPIILIGGLGELGWFGDIVKTIVKWSPFGVAQQFLNSTLSPATVATTSLWLLAILSTVYIVVFAMIGIRWFKWKSAL